MREGDRPNHGPDISPSNRGAGSPLGETLRRGISSANFPPLDPQGEGPTERDIHLSNADIQEIATIVATVMKKEKKWYSGPLLFTSGVLVGVAASVAVDRVYGDEPIPEPTPASRGIDTVPGGTSFTDDRLVPRAEAETKKVNPEEVFDPYATNGVLKAGANAAVATPEELAILFKNAIVPGEDGKPPTIRIPVPAKLQEGESIEYNHHIVNFDNVKEYDNLGNQTKLPPWQEFSAMDFNVRANTQIPLLAERVEVFQVPPLEDKGKSYFHTLVLKIDIPNSSPVFAFIVSPDDIRNLQPADNLKDAPIVTRFPNQATDEIPFIRDAEGGIPLSVDEGNMPTILTATKDTRVKIQFVSYAPGGVGNRGGSGNLPFNFITEESKPVIIPQFSNN